jgi:transposase-like protein
MKLCTSCKRKFTPDDGFLRMRFDRKDILYVVSLYRKGFSTSEVVLHMARRGVKLSRWTVILWNRKADRIKEWKAK